MSATKKFAALVTLAVGALLTGSVHAASTSGTAKATVLAPIAISAGQDLSFGNFAAGAGGTVTISETGTRSSTGVVLASGGTSQHGTFTVTGTGNSTFAITYPGAFNISNGSGGNMSVTVTGPATGTLASGTATIGVGGTVTVGASQAAGDYTGTYTMTVEYN